MSESGGATAVERPLDNVVIGGFPTARLTREELAQKMVRDCLSNRPKGESGHPKLIFSSNGQGIALAGQDPHFMRLMARADVIHADGMPVVLASKCTSKPLPDRIATTDFFHDAANAASRAGLRFFFLGASEQLNELVVQRIRETYPELEVVGRHHGYFSESEREHVLDTIRRSRPDVVWVALGKPRQEEWCVEAAAELPTVGWLKTCGGLYAFLAGDAPRAPRWMQRFGLEWLHRALDDPTRLLWRYLTTNPYAFYRIMRYTEWRARS